MTAGWVLAIVSTALAGAMDDIPLVTVDPEGASIQVIEAAIRPCPDIAGCPAVATEEGVPGEDVDWPAVGTHELAFRVTPIPVPMEEWALAIRGVGSARVCVSWPGLDGSSETSCEEAGVRPGLSRQFPVPRGVGWAHPVRVIIDGTMLAPPILKFGRLESLPRHERGIDLGFGIYYGILIAIAILSLVTFFSQRYRTYLWFAALLVAYGGALAGFSGRGIAFLTSLPGEWGIKVPLILVFVGIFALIGFGLQYLDLRRSRLASWSKEGWALMALSLLGAAGAAAFGHVLFIPGAVLLGLSCIFIISLATSAAFRGSRRGRYLLGASALFVSGLLMISLHALLSEYRGFSFSLLLVGLGSVAMPAVLVAGMYRSFRQMALERDLARNELMATQRLTILRSHYCRVTGLPRRNKLAEMFHALASRAGDDLSIGVYLINVDDLASIRQQHGRTVLEEVIVEIAGRMRDGLDEDQLLGRLEDWELVVVIPTVESDEGFRKRLYRAAENITACLDTPIEVGGEPTHLSVSIGLAVWPVHGSAFDDLIRHCDSALYDAQAEGGNRIRVYSESAFMERANRWSRLSDLRQALEREALELHYHPIHNAVNGRVRGFEALLRLRRDDGQLLLPGEFIPLAESSELIVDIGYWALARVVEDLEWLRAEGWDDFFVSLNVSPLQLVGDAFTNQMRALLERAGLHGDRLHLEITENRLVDNWERTRKVLYRMKSQGVRVYVDDFGVGYSSLSYLRELPVHGLKIDRSFVRNIGRTQQDEAVLSAVLRLAQSLKLDIIAEGVESVYQRQFLTERGCQKLQGHLFALPMARAETLDYLLTTGIDDAPGRARRVVPVLRRRQGR